MKKTRGGRALLNQPGHQSTAAIVAEIDLDSSTRYPDFTFQISDCTRSINLDVDFNDADDRANNIYKLDTMISVLKEFRKGVIAMNKRVERVRVDG
jgi:hypothetical protein